MNLQSSSIPSAPFNATAPFHEANELLRALVGKSVALLGEVILRELGAAKFAQIEALRQGMAKLRDLSADDSYSRLQKHFADLETLSREDHHEIARAFTLMLELMNSCENAYRSYRLSLRASTTCPTPISPDKKPQAIIYVLTAHPTEARSPQNIAIFHQIQNLLIAILTRSGGSDGLEFLEREQNELCHALEIAWRAPIVRERSPKVKDEAEHIYSMLFRDEVLFSLIDNSSAAVPFFVRSWVGGDKDGHPGVNHKTLLQSLGLSRLLLLKVVRKEVAEIRQSLDLIRAPKLEKLLSAFDLRIRRLRTITTGDGKRLRDFAKALRELKSQYNDQIGAVHPQISRLEKLLSCFPALVVPLELRESSDVLMGNLKRPEATAIFKMLATVERISRGMHPRNYARGLIISMTQSMDHIRAAARFQTKVFGDIRLPVIPLFEEASSLEVSDQIMLEMTSDTKIHEAALKNWNGLVEMMVGYSDSAKEAGVLASRLAISEALPKLEDVCLNAHLTPVFFHGSGGSVDRGGGSIEDQTAWWPKSALNRYKVTVQGEMVERSLATPQIAGGQFEKILASVISGLSRENKASHSDALKNLARAVSAQYRQKTTDPEFLKVVEQATPYSYLNVLKIGSRPSKRSAQLTVKGLRAIPWVLCWTQTRVLFPTWWGLGSAWLQMADKEKQKLREAFQRDPVFTSYIKALGFTLAKVELEVWRMYLEKSSLSKADSQKVYTEFDQEWQKTCNAYYEICEQKSLMWFRPWLGESIFLRSSMIHPLNLLQILAQRSKDLALLRVTVTGISSGMLTTG